MPNTTPAAARFSWKNEPELMARLLTAQNSGAYDHQDIMTFAGFCSSREQLLKHVESCEAQASKVAA